MDRISSIQSSAITVITSCMLRIKIFVDGQYASGRHENLISALISLALSSMDKMARMVMALNLVQFSLL